MYCKLTFFLTYAGNLGSLVTPKILLFQSIADSICARAGVNLSWSGEHKFGVYAFDRVHSSGRDCKSQHAPCLDKVSFACSPQPQRVLLTSNECIRVPLEGFFCEFVEFVGHCRRKETNFAQFHSLIKK